MSDDTDQFGAYFVYEQLGVGGMATVHRAESRSAGGFRKRVALKRLLPRAAADPGLVQSFVHEARLASHLHHANIAQTYDFGKVGGTYFIAMEFVPGATLTQLVRQCVDAAGPIPIPVALAVLCQICDALDYAHNLCDESGKPLGIIHRDVSPPNIIISNTGVVKLIDFGLAKATSSTVQTQVGVVKGKFSYMAPEYLDGQLDARVDLWALGVVAYELLTTRRLFDADDDFETVRLVRELPIEPPSHLRPGVPHDLDDIVMTALQRDPALRWQSAAAMRNSLAGVVKQFGVVVGNAQVIEWVEWAFTQQPRTDLSGLSQLIATLEQPSQPSGSLEVSVTPAPLPVASPASRAVMPTARRSRRTLWLLLLLLAAVTAAAGYWWMRGRSGMLGR